MHSHLSGSSLPTREPEAPGQLVTLVRLREKGKRKRLPPEQGYLVLEELVRSPQLPYRPAAIEAKLYRAADRMIGGSPPLFDPVIVRWDSRGIILQGWESSGEGVQYRQVWLVTFPVPGSLQTSAQ